MVYELCLKSAIHWVAVLFSILYSFLRVSRARFLRNPINSLLSVPPSTLLHDKWRLVIGERPNMFNFSKENSGIAENMYEL